MKAQVYSTQVIFEIETPLHTEVKADQTRISYMVKRLISNAVKLS
jgi:hypothetical protein